jgi:RNA polymerase sigma-70 factor (ECF subfamily)
MAEQLRGPLGKAVTADWVRQTLHRARDRFAELLVDEVTQTLRSPTRAELEQELSDLHLLDYCKPALDRFGTK